ncbi:tRNA dimethylallyltransferase [Cylas formicarius]|uniref:tRNA dimethylallyltransferase n=1 Tax=Cylas formicarius TaxID=197179 RepID=UPI002958C778|nr:tRNA dimethylallyltransferase [Cylas formicarius]
MNGLAVQQVKYLYYATKRLITMGSRLPLVVILGSTGSGKTKLSLELAKKFGGEVIGADSMQIYKGLDIITAKATKDEQLIAPHHMIDVLEPHETCTVVEYRNNVLKLIDELLNENKLPVVVGGTNYYIEALLWKILVESENAKKHDQPGVLPNNDHEMPSEELHKKLKSLDPSMAKRLHPNNKRKIIRALEVYYQKGKKLSELYDEQKSSFGGSKSGGGLRYSNAIVLWVNCDQETLDKRLDDRVDAMLKNGLLDELLSFHKIFNEHRLKTGEEMDYTKGIFQSIGFKEFHTYLMLKEDERQTPEGQKQLEQGVQQLKMVTRRYAKKQKRWVRNRFLGRKDRQVPPVYELDSTDVSKWNENVTVPAFEIVESYIAGVKCVREPLPVRELGSTPNSEDETHFCEACERVFIGEHQWRGHLRSQKHRRRLNALGKGKGVAA